MNQTTDLTLSDPSWLSAGRIPSLDGLRTVAIVLVLFAHAHQTRGFPRIASVELVSHCARVGVDLFFVISGFLITTMIMRERDRTGGLAVGAFLTRRFLRIVPVYLILLVVVALLQAMGLAKLSNRDWIGALTYTVNLLRHPSWEIGHVWSLSIEEHFYLVWPLLLAVAPQFGRTAAFSCIGFCFAARWVILLRWPDLTPMAELWTFTRIDSIAAGCLLGFLVRDEHWRSRLNAFCTNRLAIMATGSILVGSIVASQFSAKFSVGIAYTLNASCLTLLAWSAMYQADSAIGRFLNLRVVVTFGMGSYSIYLWQQLFLKPASSAFFCAFPLNLLLALVVSRLSYLGIERPLFARKGRPRSFVSHGLLAPASNALRPEREDALRGAEIPFPRALDLADVSASPPAARLATEGDQPWEA